jgi:hypothetical protein
MNTFPLILILTSIIFAAVFISLLITVIKRIAAFAEQAKSALEKLSVSSKTQTFQKSGISTANADRNRKGKAINGGFQTDSSAAMIKRLSEMAPDQIYVTLKDSLSTKNRLDLQRILLTRNWKREFLSFINREEMEALLRNGAAPIPIFEESPPEEELIGDDELAKGFTAVVANENGEGNGELQLGTPIQQTGAANVPLKIGKKMERKTAQKRKQLTPKQKMLMQAIIAKEIIDRPRYD